MSWPALLAAADRAALKHLGGGPVRYRPVFGGEIELVGLYEPAYARVTAGQVDVENRTPAVFVRAEDLRTADGALLDPDEPGATVTVDGAEFGVSEAQPDGQGGVVLFLHGGG